MASLAMALNQNMSYVKLGKPVKQVVCFWFPLKLRQQGLLYPFQESENTSIRHCSEPRQLNDGTLLQINARNPKQMPVLQRSLLLGGRPWVPR